MKCPKCGNDMEKGALGPSNKGLLYWAKDEFFKNTICNLYIRNGVKKAGGFVISVGNGVTNNRTNAWACRECEMVLVDCKKR